jgi:DEAD/DEAH box helicase domain-containing protein
MSVAEAIETLRGEPRFAHNIVVWQHLPERPAQYAPFPQGLAAPLVEALHDRGLASLYTHQAQASRPPAGRTSPSSRHRLRWALIPLPVLQSLLEDDTTRAAHLFHQDRMKSARAGR